MRQFIPSVIADAHRNCIADDRMPAASMFIDIRGFTALTQSLMVHGLEGAEILSEIINRTFSPTITLIEQAGGFVAGFSGDAMTAILDARTVTTSEVLAVADQIRHFFIAHGKQPTKLGEYQLSVRIGIAFGDVAYHVETSVDPYLYWFYGEAIEHSATASSHSEDNEIVFTESFHSALPADASIVSESKSEFGYRYISGAVANSVKQVVRKRISQSKFVPQAIRQLTTSGEFREVIACFLQFEADENLFERLSKTAALAREFGGYFNKVEFADKGWVALVLFGAPITFEKMTSRAADFALTVQSQFKNSCRIGITEGKAFVGFIGGEQRCEYSALGTSVNLAARLMASAERGQIRIDRYFRTLLPNEYFCESIGEFRFKGITTLVPLYHLQFRKTEMNLESFSGMMIGRDRDHEQLFNLLPTSTQSGFQGIVEIFGEAGMGKSRLIWELEQTLPPNTAMLRLRCDDVLQQPLNPFVKWIRQCFHINTGDPISVRRTRFRDEWKAFIDLYRNDSEQFTELQRIESFIASAIGLDWEESLCSQTAAKERGRAVAFAVKELLLTQLRQQPSVLVLEDFHWIDASSSSILPLLMRNISDVPVLMVITSRYLDDGHRPQIPLDTDSVRAVIELTGLQKSDLEALLQQILGRQIGPELVVYIQAKVEGNPFYCEQLALYLRETGRLVWKAGRYQLHSKPDDLPFSILSVLIARIDRLATDLKEVVQTASVLGREFAIELLIEILARVHAPDGNASIRTRSNDIYLHLRNGEKEKVWQQLTELYYLFSHTLLREAAYTMQLKKRLQSLHKLVADMLLSLFPNDREKYLQIASHYDRAGEWEKGESWHHARQYYLLSGDAAYDDCHYEAALQDYQRALQISVELFGDSDLQTIECHVKLGVLYATTGKYDAALEHHLIALEFRKNRLGECHALTAESYKHAGVVYEWRGDFTRALEAHEHALAIRLQLFGEAHVDTAASYNNLGAAYAKQGNSEVALEYHHKALAIRINLLGETHPETANSHNNIGVVLIHQGKLTEAVESIQTALTVRLALYGEKHPRVAESYINLGAIYGMQRNHELALENFTKALAIQRSIFGEKHPNIAANYNNIGAVYGHLGKPEIALEYFEKVLTIQRELLGDRHPEVASNLQNIAIGLTARGDLDRALEYLDKALRILLDTYGEKHPHVGMAYDNMGMAYYRKGAYSQALQQFQHALDIRVTLLGEAHASTQSTLTHLAETCERLGEMETAQAYRLRCKQ